MQTFTINPCDIDTLTLIIGISCLMFGILMMIGGRKKKYTVTQEGKYKVS